MSNKFYRYWKLTSQFIKIALISGTVFIITLLIGVTILTYIYRDEAKELMIESLNRNLKTEIHVDNIQLDLFRRFPNAALTFNNVMAYEVTPYSDRDTLFKTERIYFQFSIGDLIRGKYRIKHLEILNGEFIPVEFADGSNNYVFWHVSEKEPDEDFEFDLERIDLKNFDISYTSLRQNSKYHVFFEDARLSGNFSHTNYNVDFKSKTNIKELVIDNSLFISDKDVNFDLMLLVEGDAIYKLEKGLVEVSGNSFETKGYFKVDEPSNYIDLTVNGKDISLQNLISDLPRSYKEYFENYHSSGNLYFDAIIKGEMSDSLNPYVTAGFGLSNGVLYNESVDLILDNISFEAKFNNGSQRSLASSELILESFSAIVNEGKISGNLSIDFYEPQLKLAAIADISTPDLINLLNIDGFKSTSGEMSFDLRFGSALNEFGSENIFDTEKLMASRSSGSLELKNVDFYYKDDNTQYHDLNGLFRFNNNNLIIESLNGMVSHENDFKMRGYFRNILPYIFDEEQRMIIDASLVSENMNLDDLLREDGPGDGPGDDPGDDPGDESSYKLEFSDRVDFHLLANIGNFSFRKFNASNFVGVLQLNNKRFMASDITFNSMNGKVSGNAYIDGSADESLHIGCDVILNNVDVRQMFYQLGNFGQEGIKYENLKGNISADLQFTSDWSPGLEIDWKSLETTADIQIEKGELIDFKPMLALSNFLRVEDLEHVVFSELHNKIRIRDRKLFIPDMEINSNAFNIKLSGEHTFENEINYHLEVLLSELLARENRRHRNPQEQYGDVIEDDLGQTTLFLLVTGTIDKPEFRYDYRSSMERRRENLRQERENLREILREEFSWIRGDNNEIDDDFEMSEREKEMKRIEKQEEGDFVIEFDDF